MTFFLATGFEFGYDVTALYFSNLKTPNNLCAQFENSGHSFMIVMSYIQQSLFQLHTLLGMSELLSGRLFFNALQYVHLIALLHCQ